jgi:hypothetical protein
MLTPSLVLMMARTLNTLVLACMNYPLALVCDSSGSIALIQES